MTWILAGGLLVGASALLWWLRLRPSNERDWSPEYAKMPWAQIEGDAVTIHNFRHCDYRSRTDFTPHWETKRVHLSQLRGVDFLMNYFGTPHLAHTLVSFDFGAEGHVAISIETRRQQGDVYSPLRGMFRQYELCYVIGDERDLIRVRTNYRNQEVFLYPLVDAEPERYRKLFVTYLEAANELRDRPRWYHSAIDNCTTNIRLHARASGFATAWNWRLLLNGYADELLYRIGWIDRALPFAETKARARITERVRATEPGPDFSARIRTAAAPDVIR